jgi:hypothetical protein
MAWTTLTFGKHKGKTLPQIIWSDPDWFFWFYDKGESYGSLKKEAEAIYARARNIKIPKKDGKEWVLDYHTDPRSGKFCSMRFIVEDTVVDNPFMSCAESIDFYVPKAFAGGNKDKTGYRNFLKDVKAFLFGNASVHMTKERCEGFFNDSSNFL